MILNIDQKNRIEEVIKGIIESRIESFPDKTTQIRNAPFHKAILNCFSEKIKPLHIELPYLIAISSWLHGLNTSLGTGFESLAHIISGGYKRNFSSSFLLKVSHSQTQKIEEIIRDLKSGKLKPNLLHENNKIFTFSQNEKIVSALPFTVDNYVETDKSIKAIELKSVRPNSGEGRGEKQKILYAKAAFKLLNPQKEIKFFIGFPFDPTSKIPTGYDKERFFNYLIEFKKFFDPEETLIGGELWDYLSGGKSTMEEILEVIAETVKKIKDNGAIILWVILFFTS